MKEIEIERVYASVFARIKGDEGKWGVGITTDEAIGALIRAWPEEFNIQLSYVNFPLAKVTK